MARFALKIKAPDKNLVRGFNEQMPCHSLVFVVNTKAFSVIEESSRTCSLSIIPVLQSSDQHIHDL